MTEEIPYKQQIIRTVACGHCGAEILVRRSHPYKRYCNQKCAAAYWRAHPQVQNYRGRTFRPTVDDRSNYIDHRVYCLYCAHEAPVKLTREQFLKIRYVPPCPKGHGCMRVEEDCGRATQDNVLPKRQYAIGARLHVDGGL